MLQALLVESTLFSTELPSRCLRGRGKEYALLLCEARYPPWVTKICERSRKPEPRRRPRRPALSPGCSRAASEPPALLPAAAARQARVQRAPTAGNGAFHLKTSKSVAVSLSSFFLPVPPPVMPFRHPKSPVTQHMPRFPLPPYPTVSCYVSGNSEV